MGSGGERVFLAESVEYSKVPSSLEKIMPYKLAATWVELAGIVSREINPRQDRHRMISLICGTQRNTSADGRFQNPDLRVPGKGEGRRRRVNRLPEDMGT